MDVENRVEAILQEIARRGGANESDFEALLSVIEFVRSRDGFSNTIEGFLRAGEAISNRVFPKSARLVSDPDSLSDLDGKKLLKIAIGITIISTAIGYGNEDEQKASNLLMRYLKVKGYLPEDVIECGDRLGVSPGKDSHRDSSQIE